MVRPFLPSVCESRTVAWAPGFDINLLHYRQAKPFEIEFQSDRHLVILCERMECTRAESWIGNRQKSDLRHSSKKISIVPAGCRAGHRAEPADHLNYSIQVQFDATLPQRLGHPLAKDTLAPMQLEWSPSLRFTLLKMAAAASAAAHEAYRNLLTEMFFAELLELRRDLDAHHQNEESPSLQIDAVADFIRASLSEKLSLSRLSEQFGIPTARLVRAFNARFGKPPHQFIVDLRIDEAKRLLRNRNLTLTQVVAECGFADQAHMTTLFGKKVGLTPRAYRLRRG